MNEMLANNTEASQSLRWDTNQPIVDILLATYNGERYLAAQLDSLIAQTYTNWRLLVSDDCSTDGTLSLLYSYAAKDARICVVSEGSRKGGAKQNFLSLLSFSDAPYCMFCDQDDVWDPTKIAKLLEMMQDIEKREGGNLPILVFSDLRVTDSSLSILGESFVRYRKEYPPHFEFERLLRTNMAPGCSTMINRILRQELGEIRDSRSIIMHDWWAILVAAAFGRIGYLDTPLMSYRQHGNNRIGVKQYSPLKFLDLLGIARASRKTALQAREFQAVYEGRLNDEHSVRLASYVKSLRGGPVGFYGLLKSNAWYNRSLVKLTQGLSVLLVFPVAEMIRRKKHNTSNM